jgi:hypothetical protein
MGFGHRAEDLPPAPAAVTHQELDREHPAEEPGPGPSAWGPRARVIRARVGRGGPHHDRESPLSARGEDAMIGD